MHPQRPLLLLVILALAAAACGTYSSPAGGAQIVQAPALEQSTGSTAQPAAPAPEEPGDSAVVASRPPESCPITLPPTPAFLPPDPYPQASWSDYFWYGSNDLWTSVPGSGVWAGLPNNPQGYTQKIFWWNEDYVWTEEPEPDLTVTGRRLDAPADPILVSSATNAFASDIGSAMLVGVDFPTLGCWEITGRYGPAALSFVVWIAP